MDQSENRSRLKAAHQKRARLKARLRSNPNEIAAYLNGCFVGADADKIRAALAEGLRAQNVTELARSNSIDRTLLYRALRKGHLPSLSTFLTLLDILGLEVQVRPKIETKL